MAGLLPCAELCPDGKVQYAGPYAPNPTITTYRRVQIPRDIINPCPTISSVGQCWPIWFFRVHGFDLNFASPEAVPALSELVKHQFPENPATLAKIQVSWYEYGESRKANKGKGSFTGGPIGPAPGRFARTPQLNTAGAVYNSIIVDVGTGVGINLPPTGRIVADILVPDIDSFLAEGNIVAPTTPTQETMVTRTTPAGFLTDQAVGTGSATYTQAVYVDPDDQPVQRFLLPPLVRRFSAYIDDGATSNLPLIRFLYKDEAPLDFVVAEIEASPRFTMVPENAEAVEVAASNFSGIVNIVFSLEY